MFLEGRGRKGKKEVSGGRKISCNMRWCLIILSVFFNVNYYVVNICLFEYIYILFRLKGDEVNWKYKNWVESLNLLFSCFGRGLFWLF